MIIKSFPIDDKVTIPKNSRILYCDEWQGSIHVYVLCSTTESSTEEAEFLLVGTNKSFEPGGWTYVSSVKMTSMWHVFYRPGGIQD